MTHGGAFNPHDLAGLDRRIPTNNAKAPEFWLTHKENTQGNEFRLTAGMIL